MVVGSFVVFCLRIYSAFFVSFPFHQPTYNTVGANKHVSRVWIIHLHKVQIYFHFQSFHRRRPQGHSLLRLVVLVNSLWKMTCLCVTNAFTFLKFIPKTSIITNEISTCCVWKFRNIRRVIKILNWLLVIEAYKLCYY